LTEVVIIDRGFKSITSEVRCQSFKRHELVVFKTGFIAEIILEGDDVSSPVDSGVVGLEPVYS